MLKSDSGQYVKNFSKNVEISCKLNGGFIKVPNLRSLIIKPYPKCNVEEFCITTISLHEVANCEINNKTMPIKTASTGGQQPPIV